MRFTVDIEMADLVQQARGHDRQEVIEFIKTLDAEIGEWDFTLALYEHFSAQQKQWELEQAEDAAKKR